MTREYFTVDLKRKFSILIILASFLFPGCSNDDRTAVSTSGISRYTLGLSAVYSGTALPADGVSQATILVEVWDRTGTYVNGATVDLTVSLGTLASSSLTTVNGVASTTFTAGTVVGGAIVNATLENANASVKIVLANF